MIQDWTLSIWTGIELWKWSYSVCCSGDVSLISLRHLPNSIQNSSISGVQSWIISSSPGRSVFLPFFAFQITLSDIFPLETVTNSNRRHSLQLFVVEFDTCLVWGLLLLPSNANYAYVKGVRWRHLQGPNSTVWMPSIVSQIYCCVDKPRFHNSLKERAVSSSSIHPSIERERERERERGRYRLLMMCLSFHSQRETGGYGDSNVLSSSAHIR